MRQVGVNFCFCVHSTHHGIWHKPTPTWQPFQLPDAEQEWEAAPFSRDNFRSRGTICVLCLLMRLGCLSGTWTLFCATVNVHLVLTKSKSQILFINSVMINQDKLFTTLWQLGKKSLRIVCIVQIAHRKCGLLFIYFCVMRKFIFAISRILFSRILIFYRVYTWRSTNVKRWTL